LRWFVLGYFLGHRWHDHSWMRWTRVVLSLFACTWYFGVSKPMTLIMASVAA
jgi:hypothetical protein